MPVRTIESNVPHEFDAGACDPHCRVPDGTQQQLLDVCAWLGVVDH